MIRFIGFPKSSPSVVTIGQQVQVKVTYSVDIDSAQTITTTYSEIAGCVISGQKSFGHPVNKGTNKLNDTITIQASSISCKIKMSTCNPLHNCANFELGFFGTKAENDFKNSIDSLADIRVENVFVVNTESGSFLINKSKKNLHNFLKDNGFAFDRSKKIWKHEKDKK